MSLDCSLTKNELKKKTHTTKISAEKQKKKNQGLKTDKFPSVQNVNIRSFLSVLKACS